MRTQRQPDSGFTIVELLIALSVISLVLVTLFSVLGYARLALNSGQETRKRIDDTALLRRLLGESLSQIVRSNTGPSITGTDTTLMAVIAAPRLLSFLAPPLRLSLQPDASNAGLIASWISDPMPATAITHRIVEPERVVRFSYFQPSAGWLGSWNDPLRLPLAVRVAIERQPEGIPEDELAFPVRSLTAAICATQPRAPPCEASR